MDIIFNNYFYFKTVANKDSYPNEFEKNEITLNITIFENSKVSIQLETEYGKSDKANYVNAQCGISENCPGRIKQKILMEDESTTRIPLPGLRLVSFGKAIFWAVIACLALGVVILIVIMVRRRRKYKNHKPVDNVNDTPSTNI